ncbi:MAG: lytic murein transglycosylase, partial [Anaerolineales bacterium]|nr:lytic murein transglycosylase [Anaerolineales bacterium]
GKQLSATETSIRTTGQKLSLLKGQTAEIIRAIYEQGEKSLIETLLKKDGLSALFDELESLQELSQGLNKKLDEVKAVKSDLENQHSNLETKQGEKKNLLGVQALQQQNLQTKTTEQNKILKETQGKEANYQAMLADSKKRAQEIRNRIYELLGVGKQITFGEAVGIAQWASSHTGVRPEFLLAVLSQESNLGKNVGQCNIADTGTGSTRSIRTGNVFLKGIHPTRDLPPFLVITRELGMNPLTTPISCPIPSVGGWGGAMGPAQFIPSTWVLYKNKVSAITGKPANPWDIRDAFLAAALLLKDNGAAGSRSDAEWRAAMLYFSGSTDPRFRSYGDNVVAKANDYEDDIRALSG